MDELLLHLYEQRDGAVRRLVKVEGVPQADAEILVDKAIEASVRGFQKGKAHARNLTWAVTPWLAAYRRRPETVSWNDSRPP